VIRVGVVGATGKMGSQVCLAIGDADDLTLAGAISRSAVGQRLGDAVGIEGPAADLILAERLDDLMAAGVEVLVDFSGAAGAPEHVEWAIAHGMHVVEGTTGFPVDPAWANAPVGVIVVPNFAVGAALMMRFAEVAARYFDAAEVIDLHHDQKADAPSGTAIATTHRIADARPGGWTAPDGDDRHPGARGAKIEGIHVHSVRLPGLLAHQEVLFGGPGETLTIRHDATDRSSFLPGVMMAIRAVVDRPGLTVGLDALLD
jgi:4-hydroxy-tetrahydrodipicolinate reductase